MKTVAIVGTGNVGGALCLALDKSGFEVRYLVTGPSGKIRFDIDSLERRPDLIALEEIGGKDVDLIFLAVSDSSIKEVAEQISASSSDGVRSSTVFHLSGALTHRELESINSKGPSVASLHPLISIADPVSGAELLQEAYWTVEGSSLAVKTGKEVVTTLGAEVTTIDADSKVLYHAAAVMSCGHLVGLMSQARSVFNEAGIEGDLAMKMLGPLLSSTLTNSSSKSLTDALTGPFKRKDLITVEAHLKAFEDRGLDQEKKVYQLLGLESLDLQIRNREESLESAKIRQLLLLDKT